MGDGKWSGGVSGETCDAVVASFGCIGIGVVGLYGVVGNSLCSYFGWSTKLRVSLGQSIIWRCFVRILQTQKCFNKHLIS